MIAKIQASLESAGRTLGGFFVKTLGALFVSSPAATWPFRATLLFLATAGVAHWLWFFSGPLALDFEDWPKERAYLDLLREAVSTTTLPFHMSANLQMTQRFLALPETMIAPHVALLPWITNQQFITLQACFMFLVGLAGCHALARRFEWNAFSFAAFVTVFSFNGFITCRLACGHFMWAGYYLFPWMLLATLRLLETPDTLRRWIELSWVVLALFLVGSFHLAVWWMLFLGVVALIRPRLLLPVSAALILASMLCLFRIAPAAITFGGIERAFGTGYPDLLTLGRALAVNLGYDTPFTQTPRISLGWWEFDHFVGLPAVAFALIYALKRPAVPSAADLLATRYSPLATASDSTALISQRSNPHSQLSAATVLIAAGVLFIFSLSEFYAPICSLPLPLFNSERVTTRFLSVAFFVVLFLACTRFSRESPRFSAGGQALAVGLLLQTVIELSQHAALWRPATLEATHGPSVYWENSVTLTAHIVHFVQENKYKAVVAATWALSALTFLMSIFAWWRLRPASTAPHAPAA
jgi:hypothetical protein